MVRFLSIVERRFDDVSSRFSPQYLRKQFFSRQKLLEYAGLLNPLDAPHHLRTNEFWFYREGVTLPLRPAEGKGSWVDVGLYETRVQIEKKLQAGLRVTIQRTDMTLQEYLQTKDSLNDQPTNTRRQRIPGEIVSPSTPRVEAGQSEIFRSSCDSTVGFRSVLGIPSSSSGFARQYSRRLPVLR